MVEENENRYQAAAFSEGHYVQIEVAGMLKGARDKDLARDFLKFMVSQGFQDVIPTTNWMMPVTKTSQPLPDAFGKLVQPEKTFLMGSDEVAKNRQAWIDEWLNAMSMN
jgi:thiamine transport system substrate-binding protein